MSWIERECTPKKKLQGFPLNLKKLARGATRNKSKAAGSEERENLVFELEMRSCV